MRGIVLSVVGAAVLAMGGAGVASAADNLPDFCTGTKDGKQGQITCNTPTADMKWIGFARCRTPWGGGEAVWWQRSEQVQGSQTVTITCDDEGAPEVKVDLLSWEQR